MSPSAMQPTTLDCPVCSRTAIPPGETSCPGCGASLAPLGRLRELPLHYFNLALDRQSTGDRLGAIAAAACAWRLDPRSANAGILLGKLLWHSGDKDRALECWSALSGTEAERLVAAARKSFGPAGRWLRRGKSGR